MTSRVRLAELTLDAARWPRVSSLPALRDRDELHGGVQAGSDVPPEVARGLGYGRATSVFPYQPQSGYDRKRALRSLTSVVLENAHLRATFLPAVGGRLWSLTDLADGRELLATNPWLQPANLALRNAWAAGGVEWNIGTTGHSPLTFEPLHAALVDAPDGTTMLRLYEWERLRQVVFQIDAWLPADSSWLRIYVRVRNVCDHTAALYWWSNAAVPEHAGTRVLTPATDTLRFVYDGRLERHRFPEEGGIDWSLPGLAPSAADHFFLLQNRQRPWIAAVQPDGRGLAQVSTPQLLGRKLFHWGTHPGGRRWQQWLLGSEQRYAEIQAGLAITQLEHVPLAPRSHIDWVEWYGPVTSKAAAGSWEDRQAHLAAVLDGRAPAADVAASLEDLRTTAETRPRTEVSVGSGWGALEERRRRAVDQPPLDVGGTPMPSSALGDVQQPWLELLATDRLPDRAPTTPPASYQSGGDWEDRLRDAPATWETWLHLGHLCLAREDDAQAEAAYRKSLACARNPWAHHGLGTLLQRGGRAALAAEYLDEAWRQRPDDRDLAVGALEALLETGAAARALDIIDALELELRWDGRIRALEARAAIDTGDLQRAHELIDERIEVADLREGESLLQDLWEDLWVATIMGQEGMSESDARRIAAERHPLPETLDFRMAGQAGSTVPTGTYRDRSRP